MITMGLFLEDVNLIVINRVGRLIIGIYFNKLIVSKHAREDVSTSYSCHSDHSGSSLCRTSLLWDIEYILVSGDQITNRYGGIFEGELQFDDHSHGFI